MQEYPSPSSRTPIPSLSPNAQGSFITNQEPSVVGGDPLPMPLTPIVGSGMSEADAGDASPTTRNAQARRAGNLIESLQGGGLVQLAAGNIRAASCVPDALTRS